MNTQYEQLLSDILENGVRKEDRTGTGTVSTFGTRLRYDLSDWTLPLVTTKKVNFHAVVHELLWFLSGRTNIRYLRDNNVNIWNQWADHYGFLGPVYGAQWRKWYHVSDTLIDVKPFSGDVFTLAGNADTAVNEAGAFNAPKKVQDLWREALEGRLSLLWYSFADFYEGIQLAPGFEQWYAHPENYTLCPQYYGTDYLGKKTAIFVPKWYVSEMEETDRNQPKTATPRPLKRRQLYVDQIAGMERLLDEDPDSRRILLNAWNVGELDNMALPPCHAMFQLYVADGKLSGHLNQRSCDMFLGVPFNIASYSLLTMMFARAHGYEPGEFVWSGGDTHIYTNHIEQVKTQLSREARPFPAVEFTCPADTPVTGYKPEDIVLSGYDPHPFIKGEVSV